MSLKSFIKNGKVALGGFEISWKVQRCQKPSNTVRSASKIPAYPPYKLHLGPGPAWIKPSDQWVTVDIDPARGDIVVDFHRFEGFLLDSDSVDSIYASHTFEHISMYRIDKVIAECYRVLRPGGLIRIVVPNPEESIRQYLAGNENFPLFRRRRDRVKKLYGYELTLFECMKGDFVSMNGQPDLLGEKLAHQNAWDFSAMKAQLMRAGFHSDKIRRANFQDVGSDDFSFEGTYPSEANEYDRSLYVEAVK